MAGEDSAMSSGARLQLSEQPFRSLAGSHAASMFRLFGSVFLQSLR
jgi:hypothetical protein